MTERSNRRLAIRLNFALLAVSRHWLRIALVLIGLYASLPWVAPTLMRLGATGPAQVLYTLYSPFCHQFAFRSIFLFGEQAFYPRDIAETGYRPYEAYAAERSEIINPGTGRGDFSIDFWMPSRAFVGDEQMGFKTALCARDVAIYAALFVGALIYAIPGVRRRLRPLPLWIYAIAGLGPIGLDGLSQLLSYPPFELWPVRETAPFFRVITGASFGIMNAWLLLPYLEMSMQDTREQIEYKLRRAGLLT